MAKNEFICDCNIIHKEQIEKVLKDFPDNHIFYNLADFFKLLGDSTRLKILFTIDKEEMCVCDIANAISMTKSSVSHQLATLRRSGIVKCNKVGKEVYYSLDDEHVNKVFEIALEHIEHKG